MTWFLDVIAENVSHEKGHGDVSDSLGLSHVRGNTHAWFLEGKGLAITPTYSTVPYTYVLWYPDREERGRFSGQRMLEKANAML